MIEYVFRPSRKVGGKTVKSRLYSGAYSLARGEKPRRVALHTPSRKVAEKMLRRLIERKQMEREGILAPEAMRTAAAAPLASLVTQYEADLRGRGLAPSHIKETVARIRRVIAGCKWSRLGDVSAASFVAWRAGFQRSAKTRKEYQTSFNAFLNWLLRHGRIAVNPLAGVDRVETRGKAARLSRSYAPDEVSRLLAAAPESRRFVYQFLVNTGVRKNEAKTLRWESVDLVKGVARVVGKGSRVRVIPLRPELVAEFRAYAVRYEESGGAPVNDALVFSPFPSDDALHADLKRAGIDRKDASGRVVHWHAFRKTFMTWGASSGVGQRSLQAVLGHSTPVLSANVYTDVEALPLRDEVAKMPWVGGVAERAQKPDKIATASRFQGLLAELAALVKVVVPEGEAAVSGCSSLAARHGFEPSAGDYLLACDAIASANAVLRDVAGRAQTAAGAGVFCDTCGGDVVLLDADGLSLCCASPWHRGLPRFLCKLEHLGVAPAGAGRLCPICPRNPEFCADCEGSAGAGAAAPDSAERVAVRVSSGEPCDLGTAPRESANQPPSKPVCGLGQFDTLEWKSCPLCGTLADPTATVCEHCAAEMWEGGE